jgi:3-hydroxyisobutyrate dehydrogenase-like beta-hydroxyacid dehydrogenase
MTVCWLVVNTLLGVGMQVVAEAVGLGSTLDLPRDPLFDTLAKTAVVAPAHIGKLASAKRRDDAPQFPASDCARGESCYVC